MTAAEVQEKLLTIWLEQEPTARSPYQLYGCPPMWETATKDGRVLFTRPGRTMKRDAPFMPYKEVDGVHYQWQKDGKWVDQGYQADFDYFAEKLGDLLGDKP